MGLGKPDSYVAIQLNDKQSMMWGGSTEPLALCTCTSLGAINLTNNKKVVEKVRTSVPRPPALWPSRHVAQLLRHHGCTRSVTLPQIARR